MGSRPAGLRGLLAGTEGGGDDVVTGEAIWGILQGRTKDEIHRYAHASGWYQGTAFSRAVRRHLVATALAAENM
jgi:hypothetical protein